MSAESAAKRAVGEARDYLASEAPIGLQLADQLLLPMALARGGEFRTMPVTEHFRSHVSIIEEFLSRRVVMEDRKGFVCVTVRYREEGRQPPARAVAPRGPVFATGLVSREGEKVYDTCWLQRTK